MLGLAKPAERGRAQPPVAARPVAAGAQPPRPPLLFDAFEHDEELLFLPRPDPRQELGRAGRGRRELERDRALDPPLRPGRVAHGAVAARGGCGDDLCALRRRRQRASAASLCSISTRLMTPRLEELFLAAEEAEADHRHEEAAALYPALPRHRPVRRCGCRHRPRQLPQAPPAGMRMPRTTTPVRSASTALFVEAWFNPRRHDGRGWARRVRPPAPAQGNRARRQLRRRHLQLRRGWEFEARRSPRGAAASVRYLELDDKSNWAKIALRGIQFIDLQAMQKSASKAARSDGFSPRWAEGRLHDHPARAWRRRADGLRLDERHRRRARRGRSPRRALRVRLHGEPPHRNRPQAAARAETLIGEYRNRRRRARRERSARHRRQVDGRPRRQCMLADELFADGKVAGSSLPRLSVPSARQAGTVAHETPHHVEDPALICQGTRDIFGSREEVLDYKLSKTDRDPVARGRRPRPQAAQGHLRLHRRRSPGRPWPRR